MTLRVYVPATRGELARFVGDGGIGPAPVHAHAVTEWLRRSWPDGGEDEWAYAALMAAADDAAVALVAARRDGAARRVVLVAEVEDVHEDPASTAVAVDSAIPLRLLQAVHADTDDVDPSLPETLGDLGWFGVQEIADLLADLPGRSE